MQEHTFNYNQELKLESGESLPSFKLAYNTFGKLNKDKSNVVWVCHALTGYADVSDWWTGLFGEGSVFNPEEHFVICANMLGSCYGSTGPLSINPTTGKPYYHTFPLLTNRDIINSFDLLREHLEIDKIEVLIGGSMGGQQALEWVVKKPQLVHNLIVTATNARHSPWGIAFNETQRMAIANDVTWKENHPKAGLEGMKTARAIAMLSYRHYTTYEKSQTDANLDKLSNYKATTYQQYQGEKLADRFDAFSYWTLSSAMDTQSLGRGRISAENALQTIQAKTLVIGIDSDILFPLNEQKFIAEHIPDSEFVKISSDYGHDGFLVETKSIAKQISFFLSKNKFKETELILFC